MSESTRHQLLCEVLRKILRQAAGDSATAGSDQFVYFDASNPKRKCAPDGYVKLGVPYHKVYSWKTWKTGVPELCVEILSPSDTEEKLTLDEKLRRFHTMGVSEVVTFNVDAPKGQRLRAWDLIEGDLVERKIDGERTPCLTLSLWFVIGTSEEVEEDAVLRLSRDPEGRDLIPTPFEIERAEKERLADETERLTDETRATVAERDAALARVAEFEAQLRTKERGH